MTTDSGSVNDEMETNEPEPEPIIETSPPTPQPTPTPVTNTPEPPPKPIKIETSEPTTTTSTTVTSTVPVITSTKVIVPEPMPLNVSIRLPDDINERKNLIKRNLVDFNVDVVKKDPIKIDNGAIKPEKEEVKEVPEKYKTELIIPKVVAMEKAAPIKEEVVTDLVVESVKEDLVPLGGYGLKEQQPPASHLSHYPLNLKEPKEQVLNLNVYSPYGAPNKETVIKLEPRDEPMELTSNSSRTEVYNVNQPLNIPTVIPTRNPENYEEEKQRTEKLERPERVDRPERSDLAPPIGQPPLPSLMQSSNLVTIGGNPPPPMSHYGYMPGLPFAHPQSPRNLDKPPPQPQNEPQNLKIKQEVPDSNNVPVVQAPPPPPQSNSGLIQPSSSGYMVASPLPPTDPLQSLKDVKVPGFSLPSAVSQTNERPPSGPAIDNIKKEPDFGRPSTPRASPAQPPVEKSPALKSVTPVSSSTQTPPTHSPQPNSTSHSAINLISPSSSAPTQHHTSHPFSSPMHPPPHSLMHHPFLAHAMHQFHSHPYSGYPFSYPYPYGPVPQPHAIPPPHQPPTSTATLKSTIESVSTTMLSAQHTTSSSLTAKREIREPDENGTERHQTHEMTLTHQQSTSHHSSVHASSEKNNYGGGTNHSITISHSTSSSSSQSVQHKVNQKTVRTNSPHTPASQSSTTINHSSSTTSHQHTHHHTHHHERLSPSGQLLSMRHSVHQKLPQTNPHHLMIQPPSMGHLGPPAMASSSLEQLRAHAAQAVANMQNMQNQSGGRRTPTTSQPQPLKALAPVPPEEIKIEPDPEPVVEEEPQNSPPGPPRGPSPEPRIEDTECHRSQSAM